MNGAAAPDRHWLQVALIADRDETEAVEAALQEAGALSLTLEDAGGEARFHAQAAPEDPELWRCNRVVGLFPPATDPQAVLARLRRTLGELPPHEIAPLPERDWERAWLDRFRPLRFGRRLWICPGGTTPPDPEAVPVFLDPGLAFGTGTHPTTAMCLEWLEAWMGDRSPQAPIVLDYGCGSGILALAAVKLGAARAWAVDVDPQALEATAANAARNGVAQRVHTATPEALPPLAAHCLLANILADPLRELAPRLAALLRPGTPLVLSGILDHQGEAVVAAYRPWFQHFETTARGEWLRITARRR